MQTKKEKPIPPKNSLLTVLWEVLGDEDKNGWRHQTWLCQCKCGETRKVWRIRIERGLTKSCGCLRVAMGHQKAAKARAAYSEQCRRKREQING